MTEYRTISLSRSDQVATLTFIPEDERAPGPRVDSHWEVATAFEELRGDNSIRVIVLTGSGGVFCTSPRTRPDRPPTTGLSYPAAAWRLKSLTKMTEERCEELLELEPLGREYLEILDGREREDRADRKVPEHELVGQVARLAIEAFRRGEISRGRLLDLAKKLDKPADTLLKLAELAEST